MIADTGLVAVGRLDANPEQRLDAGKRHELREAAVRGRRCEGDARALDRDAEQLRRGGAEDGLPAVREIDRQRLTSGDDDGDAVLDVELVLRRTRDRDSCARGRPRRGRLL